MISTLEFYMQKNYSIQVQDTFNMQISITSDAPFLKGKPENLPHQKGEKVKEKTGELAEVKGKGKPRIMLKEDLKQP